MEHQRPARWWAEIDYRVVSTPCRRRAHRPTEWFWLPEWGYEPPTTEADRLEQRYIDRRRAS